ncbi:MAG: single-stranded-DNA-specific exonuclease RecJ [Alphaproteobacteria bacterium]|nr:single-stranded-DNA-specific exonuclease RecJ [Alphaproteobacteria bacterium]
MKTETKNMENKSVGENLWNLMSADEAEVSRIADGFGLPEYLSQIICNRKIRYDEVENFINPKLRNLMPEPFVLKDMEKAVNRVAEAIIKKQKIAIIGDYDVDGATSTSILKRYFGALGVIPAVHIPSREEGYGPSDLAFAEFKKENAELVITIDCGTTAFDVLNRASENGFDIIIIDHHEAENILPKVYAVVNPKRVDEDNPYKYLEFMSAVGVGFMFLVALNRKLRNSGIFANGGEPDLMQLLDLVALGTVCDVVPLLGLNRAYVKQGLKVMAQLNNVGLKNLMMISGVTSAPSSYHLGYVLGPRINACGRVGNADLENILLCTESENEAKSLAEKFNAYNMERKDIEDYVVLQAIEQLEKEPQEYPIAFVYGHDWHQGVIGIAAGKLRERYNVPAFVMSVENDEVKGSARSVDGIDLGALIMSAKEQGLITGGGGHMMAAGFSLTEEQIPEFKKFVGEYVISKLGKEKITPIINIDCALNLSAVNTDLCKNLEILEPYGAGNPEPKILIKNVILNYPQIIGNGHVKCNVSSQRGGKIKAICFNCADNQIGSAILNNKGEIFDIVGKIKSDNWMGRESVQIIIEDLMRK